MQGCTNTSRHSHSLSTSKSARLELGLAYLEQGNRPKAYENLVLAQQQAPLNYRSYLALAYYYQTINNAQQTEQAYKRALSIAPNNGDVLNNWGTYLCSQGDYVAADKQFNKALQQPQYLQVANSYENAGLCAQKNKEVIQAHHYFQKALNNNPHQLRSFVHLITIDIENKNVNQALTHIEQSRPYLGHLPQFHSLQQQVKQLYHQQHQ